MPLTPRQQIERLEWVGGSNEGTIYEVHKYKDTYSISFDTGVVAGKYGCGIGDEYGVVPKIGDVIRLYTEGFSTIRGIDINGVPLFFDSEEDVERKRKQRIAESRRRRHEEWEKSKARLMAEYEALPPIFKKRIDWFAEHCPEEGGFFENYLAYELVCCTDAVSIAKFFKMNPEKIKDWIEKGMRKRKGLEISDGHSGNTMGMAARLAYNYAYDERMVFFEHGAMVPLVGCGKYGCAHPRPGVEEYLVEKEAEKG